MIWRRKITTDRTDVEFSFDGTDWGQTKSTGVGHNEKVTARIRYAETDDYNASPAVSKTWNSGHGPLNRHDRWNPPVRQRKYRILDLRRLRTVFCIRGRKQEHNSDRDRSSEDGS